MSSNRFLLLSVALLAAGSLAAGCGGSGEAAEPVATTEVAMVKSYRFDPKTIEIEAGDTVTWTNDDNFTHTVRVDGQEDHNVEQGESVSIRFDTPGTYHYVCTLHSKDMDGEVIVR
jgi:plastocyanin